MVQEKQWMKTRLSKYQSH